MKFLIDENVSYIVYLELVKLNYDVSSIAQTSLSGLSDVQVYDLAVKEKRVIITRDYHFSNPFLFPANKTKGIIYIRHGNLTSQEELQIVMKFINSSHINEIEGKFITLYKDRFVIRK